MQIRVTWVAVTPANSICRWLPSPGSNSSPWASQRSTYPLWLRLRAGAWLAGPSTTSSRLDTTRPGLRPAAEQDLFELAVLAGIHQDRVPLLRPARHGPQRARGPLSADRDRRVRPLHRLGLAAGIGEPDVAAVQRRGRLAEQADDGLHAL